MGGNTIPNRGRNTRVSFNNFRSSCDICSTVYERKDLRKNAAGFLTCNVCDDAGGKDRLSLTIKNSIRTQRLRHPAVPNDGAFHTHDPTEECVHVGSQQTALWGGDLWGVNLWGDPDGPDIGN